MKQLILISLLVGTGVVLSLTLTAQESNTGGEEEIASEITPALMTAVGRGLNYLSTTQSKIGCYGRHYNVAVTSLAGLSFLAGGNLPGEGKYGEHLKTALRYIIRRCVTKRGFISEPGGMNSRMHGHGFAIWFLSEVYGMAHSSYAVDHEEIKNILKKAIKIIEESQSKEGGWYYQPRKGGDEGSVTVCIVQALRAARNVGIKVDKKVIDRGMDYLKRSANPDGSFKYQVRGSRGGTFALTAGGVSSLYLYGMYNLPETERGIEFLLKFQPGTSQNWQQSWPYYANFYAALAMYLAGEKHWQEWFPALRNNLIKKQQPNGSWPGGVDSDYATAFACLMLQIPYQYLTLFQR